MKLTVIGQLAPTIDTDIDCFGIQQARDIFAREHELSKEATCELLRLLRSHSCWFAPLSPLILANSSLSTVLNVCTSSHSNWSQLAPILESWGEACGLDVVAHWTDPELPFATAVLPAAVVIRALDTTPPKPASQSGSAVLTMNSLAHDISASIFRSAVTTDPAAWEANCSICYDASNAKAAGLAKLQSPQTTEVTQASVFAGLASLHSQDWAVAWLGAASTVCDAAGCTLQVVFVLHPTTHETQSGLTPHQFFLSMHIYRDGGGFSWPGSRVVRTNWQAGSAMQLQLDSSTLAQTNAGGGTPDKSSQHRHHHVLQGLQPLPPSAASSEASIDAPLRPVIHSPALALVALATVLWWRADTSITHVHDSIFRPLAAVAVQLRRQYHAAEHQAGGGWHLVSILQLLLLGKTAVSLLTPPEMHRKASGNSKVASPSADMAGSVWLLLGMSLYCAWTDSRSDLWIPFRCSTSPECPTAMPSGTALLASMLLVLLLAAWLHVLRDIVSRLQRRQQQLHPDIDSRGISLRHAVYQVMISCFSSLRSASSLLVLAAGMWAVTGNAQGLAAASAVACVLCLLAPMQC